MRTAQYTFRNGILIFFIFFSIHFSYAASGIFDRAVIIELNTVNYYNGTLFNTTNFGMFSANNTLILKGGQLKTYKNGPDDITGAAMYVRVYKAEQGTLPGFDTILLPWKEDSQSPYGSIDQTWEDAGLNKNLLSNLSNGNYIVEVYFEAFYTDQSGTHVHIDNNSGNNYKASFSINNCVIELGNNITYCSAFSMTIDAEPGHYSYLWNTGDTTSSIHVSEAGTYYVTITDNGCSAVDSIRIDTATSIFVLNIGNDTNICGLGQVTLNAGTVFESYLWSTGDTSMQLTVNTSGVYTITVSDINNCYLIDTCVVNFSPLPDIDIGTAYVICNGDSVLLDAGGGYAAYLWSNGASTQSIFALTQGVYAVTVTSALGCHGFDIVTVSVENHPVADFSYSAGTNLLINFTDNSAYSTKNYWDFIGNGNFIEYNPGNVSYTYPFQGTYTVRLAAVNNCDADTIEKIINVVAGIDEFLTAATFDIYPNPAIAMLVLSDPFDTVKAVEIISASGKSLCVFNYNGSGHGTQKVIDISALAPGAYYLKAEMKQSIIFKKLIKL